MPKICRRVTQPLTPPRVLPIRNRLPWRAFTRCRYSCPRQRTSTTSPTAGFRSCSAQLSASLSVCGDPVKRPLAAQGPERGRARSTRNRPSPSVRTRFSDAEGRLGHHPAAGSRGWGGTGGKPGSASTTSDSLLALPRAHPPGEPKNMLLRLRWQPRPWLTPLAFIALVPAALLWVAALADSLGLTRTLAILPTPATATSRPERLLLLATFLSVMLVMPIVAVLAGALATMSFELRIINWEITASFRLPSPPWALRQVAAGLLLLAGAVLFAAMAGHLAADCLFGTDCFPN